MKSKQSLEDYLENILLLSKENEYVHRVDVARKTGVSQPAVQKAVKILQNDGLVECDGLHIYLTDKGRAYAIKIYDKHCIIKNFLVILGVDDKTAEEDACQMEHVISSKTFDKIKKFVKAKGENNE